LAESKFTAAFCGWKDHRLGTLGHPDDDPAGVWIELIPDPGRVLICSCCGDVADGVHDQSERWVRDLPMFGMRTDLLVHRCRVRCARCGPRLEALDWLSPYARVTNRLAESVARLCKVLPVKHVAQFYGLGPERCKQIRAVAMDMNAAFDLEVKMHCPNAQVVCDLFHVVAKYGREVVDRVRVDQANQLRHDKPARQLIKRSRWLLLRNAENIAKETDRIKLAELLKVNRALAKAYILKDDLKELWDYRHTGYARRFWEDWHHRAIRSRIEPLKAFARKLKGYLPGILSHCNHPLNTSVLEGINNKIKVIKRMAYGYRDDAYFFLKIRQAFPGNAG